MIFLVLILALILFFSIRSRIFTFQNDTVIAFSGGLGSGKTLNAVKKALKLYRRERRIYRFLSIFSKRIRSSPPPELYSNFPILIKRNVFCKQLTSDILLLKEKLPLRSIVVIDEMGSYASQWDYRHPLVLDNLSTFVRFYRHFTKGGYLIVTDQCTENIVTEIRRRICKCYNCLDTRVYLKFLQITRVRMITISDELKSIEELEDKENFQIYIGFLNPFFRHYDTHAASELVKDLPYTTVSEFQNKKLEKDQFLKLPPIKDRVRYPSLFD